MPLSRRRLAAGLLVAALFAAGLLLSPRAVLARGRELAFSPYFPLVLVGLYLARPFLAWPISALSVLVGYRYGLAVGVPLALCGAVATSLIPFYAARRVRTSGGLLGRLSEGGGRYFDFAGGFRGVVVARLVPTPAEAVSAAAGAAGVSAGTFALGTAAGELPWTVAAVLAGTSMHRLAAPEAGVDPEFVAALALGAAALLVGPAYRAWRARRGAGVE